jgi:hypothetical protein
MQSSLVLQLLFCLAKSAIARFKSSQWVNSTQLTKKSRNKPKIGMKRKIGFILDGLFFQQILSASHVSISTTLYDSLTMSAYTNRMMGKGAKVCIRIFVEVIPSTITNLPSVWEACSFCCFGYGPGGDSKGVAVTTTNNHAIIAGSATVVLLGKVGHRPVQVITRGQLHAIDEKEKK